MVQVHQCLLRIAFVFAAIVFLAQLCEARRFYDDDPLLKEPKPLPVINPRVRQISDVFDFLYHTFGKHRPEGPSLGVNTLGEVPDSTWYTNRHGAHRMTIEDLVRGSGNGRPPASGPWQVVSAKTDGVTPGFTIQDSTGTRYLLKLDPPRNAELASAADVIGTRFFYAFGYNTPENYIVRFRPEQLQFEAGTKLRIHGKQRTLTKRKLKDILKGQRIDDEGRLRAMASRIIDGKDLGQFRYYGTRSDDPNDVIPHQRRRDLRGLYVFCAWLNHDDSRDINTLDSHVEEGGVPFIKHYLIDFGAILGSNSYRSDSPRKGFEYMWDQKPAYLRFATLGMYVPRWSRSAHYPKLPSVGRLESKLFEPESWKPEYPNVVFDNRTPADEFWAAKQVMAFSDDEIRALVKTGEYSDQRAEDWVTRCLIERRNKIGRAFFAKGLPLDDFHIEDGQLRFTDLAEKHGFRGHQEYAVKWSAFDNDREEHTPLAGASRFQLPPQALSAGNAYLAATISGQNPETTVIVYLRRRADGIQIVGIDRTW